MANPYKAYLTDRDLETKGVLTDEGDFAVLLARAGGRNEKYTRAMERIYKTNKRKIDMDLLDNKVGRALFVEVFVDTVILDWFVLDGLNEDGSKRWKRGIQLVDGTIAEPTKENILKVLNHPDLVDLFPNLNAIASSAKTYLAAEDEDDLKN